MGSALSKTWGECGELVWSLKWNLPFYIRVVIWFMAEQLYKNKLCFRVFGRMPFLAHASFSSRLRIRFAMVHDNVIVFFFIQYSCASSRVYAWWRRNKKSGHQSHMINEQRPKIGSIVRPDKRICFMCASTTYLRNAFFPSCRAKCVFEKEMDEICR